MKIFKSLCSIGRYQWLLIGLFLAWNIHGWSWTGVVILTAEVKFRCAGINNNNNNDNFTFFNDACHVNYTQFTGTDSNWTTSMNSSQYGKEFHDQACELFEYDHSQFQQTLTERFNLVCNRSWVISIVKSVYLAGYLVGSLLSGRFADKFGRKTTVLWSAVLCSVLHGVSAVVPNIWVYIVARFALGITDIANYMLCFVLAQESMTKHQRAVPKFMDTVAMGVIGILIPALALVVSNYRYLHLLMGTSAAAVAMITAVFAQESPRWLMSQANHEEAKKIAQKIAKFNKRDENQFDYLLESNNSKQQGQFLDLFRTPLIRKRSLILVTLWVIFILAYYAITYNLGSFSSDVRISLIISNSMVVMVTFPVYWAVQKFGRTTVTFSLFLASGACCFAMAPLVEDRSNIALSAFAVSGILFLHNIFYVLYTYTPELFPTPIRSTGLGTCSAAARVASMLSPQMALLTTFWPPLMVVTLGILSVVSAFLVPLLPDMSDVELPQTIDDGEKLFVDHGYSLRKAVKNRRYPSSEERAIGGREK